MSIYTVPVDFSVAAL